MIESNNKTTLVRPMVHDDLERVLAWRNHPTRRQNMFTTHEITLDEHTRWFERTVHDSRTHLFIFESENRPLGFINFNRLVGGVTADWGFYTAPDAPKGSGNALGRTALNYAFTHLQLHKICGQVLAANSRSIRFHQTLGFHQEGVLRDQFFDGISYHDVICFGLLSSEWLLNP